MLGTFSNSGGRSLVALTANDTHTVVRGPGEIAFRVDNLDAMQQFYEHVIGLPLMSRVSNCAFFKIADGATAVTLKCSPCSTAHRAPAIAGRTQRPRPLTTLPLRYISLIWKTN